MFTVDVSPKAAEDLLEIKNNIEVEWPDGQDICLDDLYYNAIEKH